MTNKNKNKWFKFNDTTVEEFEMNEENLTKECFGGTYKVKKQTSGFGPDLPEDRQRYWNAYMLFYEAVPDKKGIKKSASVSQARLRMSSGSGGGGGHGSVPVSSMMSPPQRLVSTPTGPHLTVTSPTKALPESESSF